jgi:hypothetical protein
MLSISLALAIAALCAALVASWFWYKSTTVKLPFDIIINQIGTSMFAYELTACLRATARMNRIAAIWTAIASVLGALSAIANSLPYTN